MMARQNCFVLTSVLFAFAAASPAQVPTDPASALPPAQGSAANAPGSAVPAGVFASGTVLSAELSKSLDTKKAKLNDKIEAKTAIDVLSHGQIVLPRNTKIIGHVTEAKAHSKASPGSILGITFDRMRLKNGREVPLPLTLQAVGRPLQQWPNTLADDDAGASSPMARQRGTIGTPSAVTAPSPQYPNGGNPSALPDPLAPAGSTVSPLGPTSRGLVGIKGLSLDATGPAAVFASTTGNVHLDGNTQLILRVQ